MPLLTSGPVGALFLKFEARQSAIIFHQPAVTPDPGTQILKKVRHTAITAKAVTPDWMSSIAL